MVFHRSYSYIKYLLRAKTRYYLHSPFVYEFYNSVLLAQPDPELHIIHQVRAQLKREKDFIPAIDFGTGRAKGRTVAYLEAHVAVKPKYANVLFRLSKFMRPQITLELGTSIGISAACMAAGSPSGILHSIDGNGELQISARHFHDRCGLTNIRLHTGRFEDQLPDILQEVPKADLIFFDGNHTKEATLRYFKLCLTKAHSDSVFVFDDIYWSAEMTEAWQEIRRHPSVRLTLDIYQFGICFFRAENREKEHFTLRC